VTRLVPPDEDRLTEQFLGTQAEAEWQRLRRQIDLSPGFWLGFLFADSPRIAHVFASRLAAVYRSHARHVRTLRAETPDAIAQILEHLFAPDVRAADAIWVAAVRDLSSDRRQAWAAAWQEFFLRLNERRDRLRRELSGGLILELPSRLKPDVRNAAPDLWSIRALVLEPTAPAVQCEANRLPGPETRADRRPAPLSDLPDAVSATKRRLPESASSPLDDGVTARLREVEGLLVLDQPAKAIERAVQTVALLRERDDQHPMLINALSALARAEAADGDNAAALGHYCQVLQLAGDSDNRELLWWLDAAAEVARHVGRLDLVEAFVLRLEAVSRRLLQQYGESPGRLEDLQWVNQRLQNVRQALGAPAGAKSLIEDFNSLRGRLRELPKASGTT